MHVYLILWFLFLPLRLFAIAVSRAQRTKMDWLVCSSRSPIQSWWARTPWSNPSSQWRPTTLLYRLSLTALSHYQITGQSNCDHTHLHCTAHVHELMLSVMHWEYNNDERHFHCTRPNIFMYIHTPLKLIMYMYTCILYLLVFY